jgi:serine/threonine protein kinase
MVNKDNILVDATPTRVARICDFGISFSLNATGGATSDSRGRGSYPYLAPEMVDSVEPGTPEADIYAFAITIWEACSHHIQHTDALLTTFT